MESTSFVVNSVERLCLPTTNHADLIMLPYVAGFTTMLDLIHTKAC